MVRLVNFAHTKKDVFSNVFTIDRKQIFDSPKSFTTPPSTCSYCHQCSANCSRRKWLRHFSGKGRSVFNVSHCNFQWIGTKCDSMHPYWWILLPHGCICFTGGEKAKENAANEIGDQANWQQSYHSLRQILPYILSLMAILRVDIII